MRIDYTDEQKELRRELQEYFEGLMPPDLRAKVGPMEGGPLVRQIVKKMLRSL